MERPSRDEVFLDVAEVVSRRGTCARRKVGCVLVDHYGHVLSTGYNGPPHNWVHCIDTPCPGASAASGTSLELCEAIHAEQNALLQCKNVYKINTCYCTHSPCIHCTKLLLNTGCRFIFFTHQYSHTEAKGLWLKDNPVWAILSGERDRASAREWNGEY